MSEHSEAEKSDISIIFGNMHLLFALVIWKEQTKIHKHAQQKILAYFKTSLAAS